MHTVLTIHNGTIQTMVRDKVRTGGKVQLVNHQMATHHSNHTESWQNSLPTLWLPVWSPGHCDKYRTNHTTCQRAEIETRY